MNKYSIELKWGALFILMGLVWLLLERLVGLHSTYIDLHPILTNFIAIPAILLYVFALKDKKKNAYNGIMSYKQGFMTGLGITLVVTVLSPLSQWITATIITPDYFTNAIEYAVSSGNATRVDAEAYFNLTSYMVQATIGALFMGVLTSAVVAAVVKSKTTKAS